MEPDLEEDFRVELHAARSRMRSMISTVLCFVGAERGVPNQKLKLLNADVEERKQRGELGSQGVPNGCLFS